MPRNCSVFKCSNNTKKGDATRFHKFPNDKKLKQKWIHALKFGRNPSRTMRVCNVHFKDSDYKLTNHGDNTSLKRGSVPSQKIPKTALKINNAIKPVKKRTTRTSARASIGIVVPDDSLNDVSMTDVMTTEATIDVTSTDVTTIDATTDVTTIDATTGGTTIDATTGGTKIDATTGGTTTDVTIADDANDKFVHDLCAQFDLNFEVKNKDASVTAAPEMKSIGIQTKVPGKRNSYSEISDKDLQYFTGLERERFIILFKMIEKFDPIEDSILWSKEDALLITLHKCRHNLDFKMMEFIFEVGRLLISETFKEVIHKLYRVLKQIDIWKMSFSDPNSYRCILDCTEFFVVRAGDPNVHQLTFSTYKHHPTFKLLVSCDEKGAVNFISDAFVGAISDREIVVKSGLIDKLQKDDAILADKGFDVSDLSESKGVLVNIPPFLRGKQQLSNYEVMKTRIIANKRILIENINCRAKKNKILVTPIQKHIWPYADKVIYVCFALVNFYKPIVSDH